METKLYQIVIGFSSQTPDYPSKITKGRFVQYGSRRLALLNNYEVGNRIQLTFLYHLICSAVNLPYFGNQFWMSEPDYEDIYE